MKRVLTTLLAVALLLGLGALAVLAMPNANAPLAAAPVVSAAAAAPEAVDAAENYNMIAMPLDATDQFTNGGFGFNSQGLAELVGASVKQVMRWDESYQRYDTWDPINQDGFVGGAYTTTPFALGVGGAYWLLLDIDGPGVVSFVGDVPEANSIKFTLVGTSPSCSYNEVSVPLEQSGIGDSDQLADSVSAVEGDVTQVLRWNASMQVFDTWDPINGDGFVGGGYVTVPWEVKIGYPYVVCLSAGVNGTMWP